MGWAACATQRLRPQREPIGHPRRKFLANTKILKLMAGITKSTTTPTHMKRSLIGSYRSDQANTHPLKKRGAARFSKGFIGYTNSHRQPLNQNRPSQSAVPIPDVNHS